MDQDPTPESVLSPPQEVTPEVSVSSQEEENPGTSSPAECTDDTNTDKPETDFAQSDRLAQSENIVSPPPQDETNRSRLSNPDDIPESAAKDSMDEADTSEVLGTPAETLQSIESEEATLENPESTNSDEDAAEEENPLKDGNEGNKDEEDEESSQSPNPRVSAPLEESENPEAPENSETSETPAKSPKDLEEPTSDSDEREKSLNLVEPPKSNLPSESSEALEDSCELPKSPNLPSEPSESATSKSSELPPESSETPEKSIESPTPSEPQAESTAEVPEESVSAERSKTRSPSPEASDSEVIALEVPPKIIPLVDIDEESNHSQPEKTSKSSEEHSKSSKSAEDDKIESVTLDSDAEKEEDKEREPENTEFVQITPDKQDDAQAGSSIDAEDPFGGDSLAADAVEPMETDEIERNLNFSNLGDQADNLQDAVNATTSKEIPKEGVEEINTSKKTQEDPKEKTAKNKESDIEVIPLESDDTSTVLPGQDDELCIVPDDMKIVLPKIALRKSLTKEDDTTKSSTETPETTDTAAPKEVETTTESTKEVTPEITDSVIDVEDEAKSLKTPVIPAPPAQKCKQCKEEKTCNINVKIGNDDFGVCSKRCQNAFMESHGKATDIPSEAANSKYEKRCASCLLIVEANDERNLSWETMEFCNEECLGKFQTKYGSYCRNCNGTVQPISLGKYCVRFGYDVRQFCCSTCLEEFKKGLKVCSYCQKDISTGTDGFLAPVGDKGQFKDFCTQQCMEKYSRMNSTEPPPPECKACSVCQEEKIVFCEVQIDRGISQAICSEPCFAAFKFVHKVDPDHCATCKKYFQVGNKKSTVVFYNNEAHTFCNKSCLNIFIITNRKIVPCNWCKVKKYNFDMIKKELKSNQVVMMCSLNCLTLYQVSINAVSARRIRCDLCKEFSQAQYHLTMSDATIRNFCSYNCVMKFQAQYTKSPITIPTGEDAPVPTGMPKRTYPGKQIQGPKKTGELPNMPTVQTLQGLQAKKSLPVISSVASLATLPANGQTAVAQKTTTNVVNLNNATITNATTVTGQPIIFKQQVITRPPSPVLMHNKMTQCKPIMHTKGVSVKPHPCCKSTQTDEIPKVMVPIPVPIYVPFPVHMFSFPFPVPVPFPLPIPVPVFIPTTRNSAKGIFKELKRIQEKMPSDPFEAELLMMAEMVATDKKTNDSDSDSDQENGNVDGRNDVDEVNDVNSTIKETDGNIGEDMLQMLKMATEDIDEPAVDLETALTPNTIAAGTQESAEDGGHYGTTASDDGPKEERPTRGKKRTVAQKIKPLKKGKRSVSKEGPLMPPPDSQSPPRVLEPLEKPDANMALKFTFGVNAWRQWVVGKNLEMEKQRETGKKVKLFKTDLLQLTADELNYSLCLFVKEVRKPNGAEYAPDTIYYLCLGIQQYLFENNRIDNVFTDSYYEKFTDCLNEVASKFSVLYNDAQFIVTRVEEEHLWECKQLGAHSPHVLLNTLMFFNTKHFNLTTVEEHMQLSFSHIMKHWKRNPAAQAAAVAGKPPGSRNVLLRFYPPQSALEANSRKKKVYEQQENEENPLRCPVKLYEFYLSKCPESVKTRNDVFYLLPERSCVPDSPVWYSTSPLAKDHLVKMLNRVRMVKEINVALWTS